MENTQERLEAIRVRLDAATPGPWIDRLDIDRPDWHIVHSIPHPIDVAHIPPWMAEVEENADFIAHAPEDIAFLLSLIDDFSKAATDVLLHLAQFVRK